VRIVVVAVGRLRPPFADDVQHYQKLLAGHTRLELVEVRPREDEVRSVEVLLEAVAALRPEDGHDVTPPREDPREGDLRRLGVPALRDLLHLRDEREVLREVLALEARRRAPVVALREIREAAIPPREEPAPERAVCDEPDPELAARGEDGRLDVAREERVLALERRDRVDATRAPERLGRGLREADPPDLPFPHETRHRANGLLYRRRGVDPMEVIEVDRVDVEPLQAPLARRADVIGLPANAALRGVRRIAQDAELRREDDPVAPARDGLPDELFVRVRAVHIGRVEEVEPGVEGRMDREDRLLVVAGPVELRHPHAAEAHRRDGGAVGAERTNVHTASLRPAIILPARARQKGVFWRACRSATRGGRRNSASRPLRTPTSAGHSCERKSGIDSV